ncbi:FAD-binding oxidoreductase [Saccharomonospora sp. NPDC046836]|uniref:FAD-binding oxidoreductase n=1 Tax=Saccharomonospora sp. NPDC046836 TaxID=3156921 RepID=UPI0033DC312E
MTETINELRTAGPLFLPGGQDYDEERTGFQRSGAHRPTVIAGATGEDDVRAAVEYATTRGQQVTVQAGGHGLNRPLDGGVLISTRRMAGVRVDPSARTAWVEAGASWQQVIDAAAPHGLAPLSGSAPGVGAVSYTLGGGIGLLSRRYGFAADHVRSLQVVTADGRLRQVTPHSEPDLYWALRGGGGNFGVVTGMEIDLMPVRHLYGGGLFIDAEQAPDVLAGWQRWTETVPDEMTSAVAMLPFPDLPMVPQALRGRHVAQLQIAYTGSVADGRQLVEPLRALGPILRDTLRELPYSESGTVFDEPDVPHAYCSANRLLSELDPAALAALTTLAGPSAPVLCVVGLRHLGGALAGPPRVPSAVGHRRAAYSLGVLSLVEPGAEDTVRAVHGDAIAPFAPATLGRLLNFSFGPLNEEEVRSAYEPHDYRRLTELKARYDPRATLVSNHPIPAARR